MTTITEMRRTTARLIAIAIALFSVSGCSSKKNVPHSVKPFQIVGETAVIRRGDPLPATSPIFDGKRVRLRAVRGETVAVVVVLNQQTHLQRTSIRAALDGPALSVRRFRVEFIEIKEPSTALFGKSRGKGFYPDRLIEENNSSPTSSQPTPRQVLFDINVQHEASPGIHHGTIQVGATSVPIDLEVLPYSIRLERSPLVWVWYLADEVNGSEPGVNSVDPLAIEKRYRDLFLEHGALLATDLSAAQLQSQRPLLIESASYWPVRVRAADPKTVAANARQIIDFFDKLGPVPFTIPIDEPSTDERRREVNAYGAALRSAGSGTRRLLHAVTDWKRPIYDDSIDVFISPKSISEPNGEHHDHRWTYNGRPPQAGNMTIDSRDGSLRSWGWIAYRYKVELWYAWEGLYFTDRYNKATQPTDFSTSALSFDERRRGDPSRDPQKLDYGNGDGLLAYPHYHPSLRLKALRRGLTDRLLLIKLAACGFENLATEIARTTVPRALADANASVLWPTTSQGWHNAREAILAQIIAHCPAE